MAPKRTFSLFHQTVQARDLSEKSLNVNALPDYYPASTVKYFRQFRIGLLASKCTLAVDRLNSGEETKSRYDQGIIKTALLPSVALSVMRCNEATKWYVSGGHIVTGIWRLRK